MVGVSGGIPEVYFDFSICAVMFIVDKFVYEIDAHGCFNGECVVCGVWLCVFTQEGCFSDIGVSNHYYFHDDAGCCHTVHFLVVYLDGWCFEGICM